MASVKIVLRRKKNTKGEYPIVVRITKDRKSSFIYTGQYVKEGDFDKVTQRVKKSHPNSKRLNNLLLKKLAEANDKLLELETGDEPVTAMQIKEKVGNKSGPISFFKVANEHIWDLQKAGKHNRVSADKPRINHLKAFTKKRDVVFTEITVSFLKRFKTFLKDERGLNPRSIMNCLVMIRTIFNIAIRDEVVDRKYYPFGKGKIVIRFPESIKIGLTIEEVKKLESLEYEKGSMKWHVLNVWLISFYFAGMRVSDVVSLKWSDIKDERLSYTMGKNSKVLSLKVPEKADAILMHYLEQKSDEDDFMFPEMKGVDENDERKVYRKKTAATKKFNKYLKRIADDIGLVKPLTMHISRHTFANISGDKIPIQILQKLYRHSHITTTIGYQKNFMFKDADDALDSVIDF